MTAFHHDCSPSSGPLASGPEAAQPTRPSQAVPFPASNSELSPQRRAVSLCQLERHTVPSEPYPAVEWPGPKALSLHSSLDAHRLRTPFHVAAGAVRCVVRAGFARCGWARGLIWTATRADCTRQTAGKVPEGPATTVHLSAAQLTHRGRDRVKPAGCGGSRVPLCAAGQAIPGRGILAGAGDTGAVELDWGRACADGCLSRSPPPGLAGRQHLDTRCPQEGNAAW